MNLKFYNGVTKISGFVLEKGFHPTIIGAENIDPEKNYLFAGNHITWADPLLLVYALNQLPIHFMSKQELFNNKLLAYFLKELGAFPIDRGNNDLKAVKMAINLLKEGYNVGIFPEGTRNKELGEFKSGIPRIATIAKKEIVPFGISGDFKINGNLTIKIGEPINFQGMKKDEQDKYLIEKIKQLI